MDLREYQKGATNTFKPSKDLDEHEGRILNWALGLANEAGEVAGVVKHLIFHNEPFERMEVAKEIGDVLWYVAALCTTFKIDMGVCAELNLAKLTYRHGGVAYDANGSAHRHERESAFEQTELYKQLEERIKCE